MVVKMTQVVADLPVVATSSGNEKRLIFLSFRALATIATSYLKIRESSIYKSLSKLVAVVASSARTVTSVGSAHKESQCPSSVHLG
jgi:hypothetical protein